MCRSTESSLDGIRHRHRHPDRHLVREDVEHGGVLVDRAPQLLIALGRLRTADANGDRDIVEPRAHALLETQHPANVEVALDVDLEPVQRDVELLRPEAVGVRHARAQRGEREPDRIRSAIGAPDGFGLVDLDGPFPDADVDLGEADELALGDEGRLGQARVAGDGGRGGVERLADRVAHTGPTRLRRIVQPCDLMWSITWLNSSVGEKSTYSVSSSASGAWPGAQ